MAGWNASVWEERVFTILLQEPPWKMWRPVKSYTDFSRQDWNGNWLFALSTDSDGFCVATRAKLHFADFAFQSRKLAIAPDYRIAGEGNLKINASRFTVFEARSLGSNNTNVLLGRLHFHYDCIELTTRQKRR